MGQIKLKIEKFVGKSFCTLSVIDVNELFKIQGRRFIQGTEIEDWQDYCMFCAHQYWIFNDNLEQVICAPCNTERSYFKYSSLAWRCQDCRLKKKIKAFDDRQIIDPLKFTFAESTQDRPRLWRFPKEIKVHGV